VDGVRINDFNLYGMILVGNLNSVSSRIWHEEIDMRGAAPGHYIDPEFPHKTYRSVYLYYDGEAFVDANGRTLDEVLEGIIMSTRIGPGIHNAHLFQVQYIQWGQSLICHAIIEAESTIWSDEFRRV